MDYYSVLKYTYYLQSEELAQRPCLLPIELVEVRSHFIHVPRAISFSHYSVRRDWIAHNPNCVCRSRRFGTLWVTPMPSNFERGKASGGGESYPAAGSQRRFTRKTPGAGCIEAWCVSESQRTKTSGIAVCLAGRVILENTGVLLFDHCCQVVIMSPSFSPFLWLTDSGGLILPLVLAVHYS